MNNDSKITYRKASFADMEFLRELDRACYEDHVVKTFGSWDESLFDKGFDPAIVQIVQLDGIDIGMIVVRITEKEVTLQDIAILPDYQNQGLGSRLLERVIKTAQEKKKPLHLKVFKVSPAVKLYQRHGFEQYAEDDTHFSMVRK